MTIFFFVYIFQFNKEFLAISMRTRLKYTPNNLYIRSRVAVGQETRLRYALSEHNIMVYIGTQVGWSYALFLFRKKSVDYFPVLYATCILYNLYRYYDSNCGTILNYRRVCIQKKKKKITNYGNSIKSY